MTRHEFTCTRCGVGRHLHHYTRLQAAMWLVRIEKWALDPDECATCRGAS